MRPIAVGRCNWIHIGSEQAGPRVAAIFSLVESCRRLKTPVRDHLADILPDSHLPHGPQDIRSCQPCVCSSAYEFDILLP
jgi:hypothetical protein